MNKTLAYARARILQRMLVWLSLPLLSFSCNTQHPSKRNVVTQDSLKMINQPGDTASAMPADTLNPNYVNPHTICEYGVPRVVPEYDTLQDQLMYGVIRVDDKDR